MITLQQQAGEVRPIPLVERPPLGYLPRIYNMPGNVAGIYRQLPKGVILHGSRSGSNQSTQAEFTGTANYATNPAHGLGWTATVGDDVVAIHMPADRWGWNARAASDDFLAVEFAQPTMDRPISDAQVRAFCWLFKQWQTYWGQQLPLYFPTHAEVEKLGLTGSNDGKTDVFPWKDPRAEELRARIYERLKA